MVRPVAHVKEPLWERMARGEEEMEAEQTYLRQKSGERVKDPPPAPLELLSSSR